MNCSGDSSTGEYQALEELEKHSGDLRSVLNPADPVSSGRGLDGNGVLRTWGSIALCGAVCVVGNFALKRHASLHKLKLGRIALGAGFTAYAVNKICFADCHRVLGEIFNDADGKVILFCAVAARNVYRTSRVCKSPRDMSRLAIWYEKRCTIDEKNLQGFGIYELTRGIWTSVYTEAWVNTVVIRGLPEDAKISPHDLYIATSFISNVCANPSYQFLRSLSRNTFVGSAAVFVLSRSPVFLGWSSGIGLLSLATYTICSPIRSYYFARLPLRLQDRKALADAIRERHAAPDPELINKVQETEPKA